MMGRVCGGMVRSLCCEGEECNGILVKLFWRLDLSQLR